MGALVEVGRILSGLIILCKGKRHRSKFLHLLSFGPYVRRIKNPATDVDWVSRDPAEVKKYHEDPDCGFPVTTSFFYDMFTGLHRIHKKAAMEGIPKTLPLLLMSGDEDPVGTYGKTVSALTGIYRTLGIQDVTLTLYPGGRHEMLSEVNKEEVISDVLGWIDKRIAL
jgi:alpha-beta hydrolase superfamily lysophospholipase